MKFFVVITFLLVQHVDLLAQPACNDDDIMAKTGKWTKRPDATMKATGKAQVIARIDKLSRLIQDAYPNPRGMEAAWYRSMGGYYPPLDAGCEAYELNTFFFTWYCNSHLKKLMLGTEASSSFNIGANKFGWFADEDKNFLIGNRSVYLLSKEMESINGFASFAGSNNSNDNTGQHYSRSMLICRKDRLPYKTVTRKQYLLAFLQLKEIENNSYIAGLQKMKVRTDAEEEVYKNTQLARVVNRPEYDEKTKEKAKANFLRGYTTEKQRQEADIKRAGTAYQATIKAAQDYLQSHSEDEVSKPAYVQSTSYSSSFMKFAEPSNGRMLVQVDPTYFDHTLPAYVPQFFMLYWSWNYELPSKELAKQLTTKLNLKAIQELLDK